MPPQFQLWNPWDNNFDHREWNATEVQWILDYAESRFHQILLVVHNSTGDIRSKLCKFLSGEMEYVLAVIGQGLLGGWDIRINIITRSLVAENIAFDSNFDLPPFAKDVVDLLNADTDDPATLLVKKYHNDWWNNPKLPVIKDNIAAVTHKFILSKHNIGKCLEVDRPQRAKSGSPSVPLSNAKYTWNRATLPNVSDYSGCQKCLAYHSVACSAHNELMSIKTQVEGMETIFEARWQNALRRSSAVHQLYVGAIRKEETTAAYAAPSGTVPPGPPPVIPAPAPPVSQPTAARGRAKQPNKGKGKQKRQPSPALDIAALFRAASSRERNQWQALPTVQWSHGANLDLEDLPAIFTYDVIDSNLQSGYEISLPGEGSPPLTRSDINSMSPPPAKFDDLTSSHGVPSLSPDEFPHHFSISPLGPGSFRGSITTAPIFYLVADGVMAPPPDPFKDDAGQLPGATEGITNQPQLLDLSDEGEFNPQLLDLPDEEQFCPQLLDLPDEVGLNPELLDLSDQEAPIRLDPEIIELSDSDENIGSHVKLQYHAATYPAHGTSIHHDLMDISDPVPSTSPKTPTASYGHASGAPSHPKLLILSDDENAGQPHIAHTQRTGILPNAPTTLRFQPEIMDLSDIEDIPMAPLSTMEPVDASSIRPSTSHPQLIDLPDDDNNANEEPANKCDDDTWTAEDFMGVDDNVCESPDEDEQD